MIARYILEDCDITANKTKFRNLITIGTPNMGISMVTKKACESVEDGMRYVCALSASALTDLAYSEIM